MKRARERAERDSGAALILAIGFVVAVGAISGGLAALATTSLNNRNTLEVLRDREFAAEAVVENAIVQARAFDCTTLTTPILETFKLIPIRVELTNACLPNSVVGTDGLAYPQRNVIFSACVDATPTVACAPANVIIRAQVNFEPSAGPVTKTFVQSWNVNR